RGASLAHICRKNFSSRAGTFRRGIMLVSFTDQGLKGVKDVPNNSRPVSPRVGHLSSEFGHVIVRSFCWCRTLRFGTSQNDNARDRGCRDDDRSGGGISPLASFAERPRRCSFRLTRPAMERKRFRVMACPCKPLSMVPSR